MVQLTTEQQTVIDHPINQHARVLAVAGSGKSTTLAYRIDNLIHNYNVSPDHIQVLMFNSLARKQFYHHLDKTGLPPNLQPSVQTFHSFCYQVLQKALLLGYLHPKTEFWLSDKSELIWLTVKRAITNLEKSNRLPPEFIDPDQALQAISLWKSSLTTPQNAGSSSHPFLPIVFQEYERLRLEKYAITYDDFIPTALSLLENDVTLYARFCSKTEFLIVDEYQDINAGQQALIELISGDRADLMVVGDDDQTIYEWRGARPNFIIHEFGKIFNNKPISDYRLSHSFRFGPVIAQCAANVIQNNLNRVEKPLVANEAKKLGFIEIQNHDDSTHALTNQVLALLNHDQVSPQEIVVLARMYAQLTNLEADFLEKEIPYEVDGQQPFYKRKEIKTLLDYMYLAKNLLEPLNLTLKKILVNVANKPSRFLSRYTLESITNKSIQNQISLVDTLRKAAFQLDFNLTDLQAKSFQKLLTFLERLQGQLKHPHADQVLEWMVFELGYLDYFQKYYGSGETSSEKSNAVLQFIKFVQNLNTTPLELIGLLNTLDTTRGEPAENLIRFTTIFRTKGLEFDYVIIPQCNENFLPYLNGQSLDIHDLKQANRLTALSSSIENERRLFYVGITRARKGVFIGTSGQPSRFLQEIQLEKTQSTVNAIQQVLCGNPTGLEHLHQSIGISNKQEEILNTYLSKPRH